AGLGLCFAAAVPFFWNTLAADLFGATVLFGLDALSRRSIAWRPGIAAGALLLAAGAAAGQQLAPVSEDVVVTANSVPEEEKEVGSAITVITREQIEKSEKVSVSELLRSVPGLDVVQSGTPGSVTSVFTRGANSNQTLVLVDGVRMNSPYFGGFDWTALTTENIERIEIARGPFSALYGSDAIGGVVQIFTRSAAAGFSGRATGAAGNQGQGEGSGFLSYGEGDFRATGSYRYSAYDGDRPNTDWRQRNAAASVEAKLSEGSRVAVEAGWVDGEVGNPGPVGAPSTARGILREDRLSIPGSFALSDTNRLDVLLAGVRSKPEYLDPDGGFLSHTDAETLQARVADTARLGAHEVTAFASWQRWTVDDETNFGPNIESGRSTIWGLGAQDTATFGAFTITAGLRYDDHSVYGSAWSPRATVAWLSSDGLWKVRASGGSGFRAPTIGELYYPFIGNPDLKPERSVSWELGAERYVGSAGRAQLSLFWNEYDDLIVYDFAAARNLNVGNARARGVEVGWSQPLVSWLSIEATYTYLNTENLDTGAPLLRRPENRGALGLDFRPLPGVDVIPRVILVGSRADADPLTGEPVEDPSYTRVDLLGRWQATPNVAPYLSITNLLDRRYDEAAGFPAAGFLIAGGLDVRF
ncbi:MAG TPA: TonB-dependent receptor, partial [Thermoanaerobaculia bacterium]